MNPVSRPAHPAEIMQALGVAHAKANAMASAADRRGDPAGAAGYRMLAVLIEIVEKRADQVREIQNWERPPRP